MVRTHKICPYHLTPDGLLALSSAKGAPHLAPESINHFHRWCVTRKITGVDLYLQWRRTHYAVEMPELPRQPPLLEKPPMDYYIEAKRTDRWLVPSTIDFVHSGRTFFRARAIQIFEAAVPEHQPFFSVLIYFLTIARIQHPYLITGEGPQPSPSARPRVPAEQRIYAPAWNAAEIMDLRRIFGPDETGHRNSLNEEDWDALLPRLQPHHRDRRAVYRKIVSMNEALRKTLTIEGALTPAGRKIYMKQRLGQFERAPRIRVTDLDYTPRVKPPAKEPNPGVAPSLRDEVDEGAE